MQKNIKEATPVCVCLRVYVCVWPLQSYWFLIKAPQLKLQPVAAEGEETARVIHLMSEDLNFACAKIHTHTTKNIKIHTSGSEQ